MYAAGRGTKQNYKKGAEAVFKAIRKGNKFSKDQMIGNHTVWPIGFRKELQKILKNYGYYNGAADGNYGPGTVQAVRKAAGE